MATPKIKGIAFDFGGEVLVIPPLSLGSLEVLQERLGAVTAGASVLEPESVRTIIDAALAALIRNYPALTREQVKEMLDVANMQEVLEAVMDVSGLRRKGLAAAGKPEAGSSEIPAPSPGTV